MMKRIYKLRFAFTAIIVSICFVLAFGSITSRGSEVSKKYKLVSVKEGDTLWGIVKENCKNSDIRKAIYYVKKENSMDSGNITPGQTIKIPLKYTY